MVMIKKDYLSEILDCELSIFIASEFINKNRDFISIIVKKLLRNEKKLIIFADFLDI